MKSKKRELLFNVTSKDCKWQFYRGSGNGGQNRNKRDTAARCIHEPSGAVACAEEERTQLQNKRIAFKRMASTQKFKTWLKTETARRMGTLKDIGKKVDYEMEHNVKVEVKDEKGRWVKEDTCIVQEGRGKNNV